ncbi:MAG: DUF5916 domain-containing protein [Steroidobacteraceae bacterium]
MPVPPRIAGAGRLRSPQPVRRPAAAIARLACLFATATGSAAPAAAQSSAAAPGAGPPAERAFVLKTVAAPRITGHIHIDGRLDEPAWRTAASIADLTQYSPGNGDPPSERTEFLVMSDEENLYIAARFGDSDPRGIKRAQLVQGQTVVNDDYVQILLDPYNNRRTGYTFYVNPNGVQRDGLLLGGMSYNMDWDGIWQADAQLTADGWSAEMAIPFKTLSFDARSDTWGINFIRSIRRKREDLVWSHKNRRITLDLSGEMRGMGGRDQGRGLDVVPSLAFTQRERFMSDESSLRPKPSLDVFYRITPSLRAALTVNTDFSATEVDDRQVNLTRFSLFFPEKRDFFLEDAELFEFGGLTQNGRPFFSRTIGLSALGQPIDLDGGLKVTGRIGRYNVGALAVRQAEDGGLGAKELFVARGYAGIGEQSTLGGIVTWGDPASDRGNHVVGIDLDLRAGHLLERGLVEGRAWAQRSSTDGLKGRDDAWGVSLAYPNDDLDALIGWTSIGQNFRPALGFVNRTGIEQFDARAKYRYRFAGHGLLRSVLAGVEATQVMDPRGNLESRLVTLTPLSIDNQPGDTLALDAIRTTEVLQRTFLLPGGLRVRPGRYDFDRLRLYTTMAGFRRLGVNLDLESGDFYDGRRDDARVTINWKPNEHLAFSAQYQANRIDLPAADFTTRVATLGANVAFNVRWAWLNMVQYDNVSGRLGVNSRLRWWPRQGQVAYFVVNYDWRRDAQGDFLPFLAETTLKFDYTFRF